MAAASVKIHEAIKVTPFSSDSTTSFTLPLTYFDFFWLKFPPVERLFFYQICDLTWDSFSSVILPKLKHSLSLTVHHYLPLAGHIMWPLEAPKPAVYFFPNDGVSFTVAESNNADFNHLSSNGIRRAVEFRPLVPEPSISDDKAEVIAIQITLFPNQEDKNDVVLSSLPLQLTPCFDRSVIKDPKGLDVVYANHWLEFANTRSLKIIPMKQVNSDLVRMTFEMRPEDITKLRDKIKENILQAGKSAEQLHLSTHVLACAHSFVCLVKAYGEETDTNVMFGVAADCRSRLDPPLPVNYFGNCVGGQGTVQKASYLMGENGEAFVAEKLSDCIKELKGDVIEGSEDKFVNVLGMMKGEGLQQRILSVAGSNRFDVYGSDFGWGKPKKVEIVSIDKTGAISLAESGDGSGGIEVGVVLEKHQMEVFASLFTDGLQS
ncbi:Acyltransferase-like protein [Citrus sinensis]|uniref:Acyltransferase-like protein n=1 Tax=Citrus sinensis TaxID=2711 RepID=A0ACB8NTM4_CITSI|nr:Acyltransferase-like protein [Citrus sinensis]